MTLFCTEMIESGVTHQERQKKGGGLCIYIKAKYNVSEYDYQNLNDSSQDGEFKWLLIENKHCKNIFIVNCYRPPSRNIDSFIKSIERKHLTIDRDKNDFFVTGDINIDLNDDVCNNAKQLKTTLGFSQLIKKVTRYGQNKESLLDVIYTNSSFISRSGVCNVNISDQQMVYCTSKKIQNRKREVDFKADLIENSMKMIL